MFNLHCPFGHYGPHGQKEFELTENTKKLRWYMEEYIAKNGHPPSFIEMMKDTELTQQETWDSLHQMHLGVQVMFVPGTQSIGKMPPFAFYPTRHRVFLEDGREFYAGCAGEASAFSAQFPGITCRIESVSPARWETITSVWKDGALISVTPDTTVLHIGLHPSEWSKEMYLACERINYFTSREEVREWEAALPELKGAILPIERAQEWVSFIATRRHHEYDRGPDVAGPELIKQMLDIWRSLGADLSNWEDAKS